MLLDNQQGRNVADALATNADSASKLRVLTSEFTLYGFAALAKQLRPFLEAEILLTKPVDSEGDQAFVGTENDVRMINQLDQRYWARQLADWLDKKADVRNVNSAQPFGQNLFLLGRDSPNFAVSGSSTFSPRGLGLVSGAGMQFNTGSTDQESLQQLDQWFSSQWSSPSAIEAKQQLLAALQRISAEQSAASIYFKTLFHLFKDSLNEIDEESIIRSKTGFKDTLVWNKLYKFQRDGVLGAIDKLERHNGCIIADSVGLGKTFEALAVIKYYELRNDRVLVLCPKKLRDNWTMYTINDKRNLLAADRFNYDVLNHTDLSRIRGYSGEINLETLNWSNYDLVVIDESHNFRNNPNRAEGKTRYERLLDDLICAGVKTKVLMLSATPVNNRLNDLKNQIAFITEARDDAFADDGVRSVDVTLRRAQQIFNQWQDQPEESRRVKDLLEQLNFDYFKLLDTVTIARSRKHIQKYYGTADMGEFPRRLPPVNIYADIDSEGLFPDIRDVNKTIRRLSLACYSPLKYVRDARKVEYARRYDKAVGDGQGVFRQVDREESLVHLMRVNLLKRMESSIHSFHLTSKKLLAQIEALIDKVHEHQTGEIVELNIEEIEDIELNSPELERFMAGNKTKVLLQDVDLVRYRQDLEADRVLLQHLVEESKAIKPVRDAKLAELKAALVQKVQQPLNPGNKKAIVFTAFSDTAQYLYSELASWASQNLGIQAALVTGSGQNRTTIPGIKSDLNGILTAFSPVSKERAKIDPSATQEIDLLIATDCISEGQNLQDCDTLINYDIHWNPVRIIQRFGRVDRLGSKNKQIQLINFWPNMELDEYINLEARVSGRMVLLDISATGEENVIDENAKEMNDLEYRRKQLQQLQEAVVDLEDMAGGVSITDLTLNDFRMDLSGYIADNSQFEQLERSALGQYGAVTHDVSLVEQGLKPGVIFCLENIRTGSQAVQVDDNYPLAPYFLVYVSDDAVIELNFTQSKKVLDLLKRQAFSHSDIDEGAANYVNDETKQGRNMEHYQHLLAVAVDSIAGKSEEKGVESLFTKGGTVLTATSSQGIEDFAVVCYLILVDQDNAVPSLPTGSKEATG